jgi:ParB family chromosome partitioning protein
MKRDALNHQGVASPQVGEKLLTVEKIGAESGDSKNQVLRYIRLTYLIPELLTMVDENKIAFSPAVEISYLEQSEQLVLLDAINLNDCTPSHAQSIRLKKLSQEGLLDNDRIYEIMSEEKPNQREKFSFRADRLRRFIPESVPFNQTEDFVCKALEHYQQFLERQRKDRGDR